MRTVVTDINTIWPGTDGDGGGGGGETTSGLAQALAGNHLDFQKAIDLIIEHEAEHHSFTGTVTFV